MNFIKHLASTLSNHEIPIQLVWSGVGVRNSSVLFVLGVDLNVRVASRA